MPGGKPYLAFDTMTIPVLYEDDTMLAVDKPEGLSSIPERNLAVPSLLRILEEEHGRRFLTVHRLDKEASGVIVFAKDAESHRRLNSVFSGRSAEKTYLLLVHGTITVDSDVIDLPLRQFGSGRMGVDPKKGKTSMTQYHVLERFAQATYLEAHPLTGRRHQLRVHFYATGHPLVGDPRYGTPGEETRFARLMLHAASLGLPQPDGPMLRIQASAPPAFDAILQSFRG